MTVLRIGFFVYEYPPQLVGGLGTYAEYITQQYVDIGHDVSVFTLNNNGLQNKGNNERRRGSQATNS